jgi:hypothetical protein
MENSIENPAPVGRCGAREAIQFTTDAAKDRPGHVDTQVLAASVRKPSAVATIIETPTFDLDNRHDVARAHGDADPAPSTFDYGSLDSETAASVRATAEIIRERMKHSIIETGRDLIQVKAKLEHGAFGPWLDAEFEMSVRTAQNYMRAAELADTKSETVSHLPATILFRLAAPSTPEAARDDVIARLEMGEQLTLTGVNRAIRVARADAALDRKHDVMAQNRRWKRLLKKKGPSPAAAARLKLESERRLAEEAAAQEAVALLRSGLGVDFSRFFDLWNRSGLSFSGALSGALPDAGNGHEPRASISIDEPVGCLTDEARP